MIDKENLKYGKIVINMKFFIQILFSLFTIFLTNIGAVASVSYCNETGSAQEEKFILLQESVEQVAVGLL
jgi:hypothetical protein